MKKTKLHIEIDEEVKKKLDELRVSSGMKSTNELIRFILAEYLLKRGK
jgi:metal-responsive CopG/Arc/MetJ family transcriptional regulator